MKVSKKAVRIAAVICVIAMLGSMLVTALYGILGM